MKHLQKGFIVTLIATIITLLVIGGSYVYYKNSNVKTAPLSPTPDTKTALVGNDRDSHGCIGSAGYSWCAEKDKCVRAWEEKCEAVPTVKKSNITPPNTNTPLTNNQTIDFSTYKNTKYGFELSIPKEWRVISDEGKGCCGETSVARFYIGENPFSGGMDRGLSLYVHDRTDDKRYEGMRQGYNLALATDNSIDNITKNRERCISEHIKDIKVGENNLSAIEVYDATNDCFSPVYQIVVKGSTYDFVITPWPTSGVGYVGYDGKLEVAKTLSEFDQILSSFKLY